MTIKSFRNRKSERGNVFFTLFGAVAIVGVLGAGIMATMRGPLSTMVNVNRRTQAEADMNIASKLVLLEATQDPVDGGDCDADGFVEPLEYKVGTPAPTGGGHLPDAVGSNKLDPWGTPYGYCAWDAGPDINVDNCAGENRLAGNGGPTDGTYTVIALISAGPDQNFESTCTGGATPNVAKAAGSDDMVTTFSYETASAATGGLWSIKPLDPDTAIIPKNIEAQGATFTGPVDLSASASMFLPNQNVATTCNSANIGIVRVNTTTDPDTLEVCDDATDGTPGGPYTWQNVALGAAGVSLWKNDGVGGPAEIYYNGGNVGVGTNDPTQPLDVSGNARIRDNVMLDAGSSVVWDGAANDPSITENASGLDIVAATTQARIKTTGVDLIGNTTITGSGATDATNALVVSNSTPTSIFVVENDGEVGIGVADPNDKLDVSGSIDITDHYKLDGVNFLTDNAATGTTLIGKAAGAGVTGNYNTILGAGTGGTLTTGTNNILIGSNVTPIDVPAATTSNYLSIGNLIYGDLANGRVGIGTATLNDALEVNGNIDASGNIEGTIIHATDDLTAADDVIATGDISGTNITASNTVTADIYKLDGLTQDFSAIVDCDASTDKVIWTPGTGWGCATDLQGGSGGGGQNLGEVLTVGNNAATLNAVNFGGIAIGSATLSTGGSQDLELDVTGDIGATNYCDQNGNNCFTAATASSGGTAKLNTILAADGNNTIGSAAWNQVWNWQLTAAETGFAFGETAASTGGAGDQFILAARTLAASTATPFIITNLGAANSFRVNDETGDADASPFVITATGRVGIGTASPGTALTVTGNHVVGQGLIYVDANAGQPAFVRLNADANQDSGFGLRAAGAAVWDMYRPPSSTNLVFADSTADRITFLQGGEVGIGDSTPDDGTGGGGQNLLVDIEGPAGATYYCDQAGLNCFTAASVAGSGLWERNGTVIRIRAPGVYATDDFVFGAAQLADIVGTDDDARMFFDKSKAAFRAGLATSTHWDDANVGTQSTAFGVNTVASGNYSTALGASTTASGHVSTTMGTGNYASGDYSATFGAHASVGNTTVPNGTGNASVAFGLIDSAVTITVPPKITGIQSMGIFMGDQDAVNVTASNIMALLGGRIVLDPDDTSAANVNVSTGVQQLELDVQGDIGAINYCDEAGNNCFTPASVATNRALSAITAATAGNSINNADHAQVWNWNLSTNDKDAFTFTENTASSATGHSSILKAATLATSTATPLRVTNLGAGDSFVVNDETGDADASPFVIAADGKVSIGTTTPDAGAKLDVHGPVFVDGDSTGNPGDIFIGGGGWPYNIGVGWSGYSQLYINAVGTGGGTADFRDLGIMNGKANMIAFYQGSTKRFSVGGDDTTPDAMLEVLKEGASPLMMLSATAAGNGDLMIVDASGNVGIGLTSPASKFVVASPASESIAAAATITANSCGTVKQVNATGNQTTNTIDTFTAPTASYAGCCMDVVNVDTVDTITLDQNAKFITGPGTDLALGPGKAVRVCSDGTSWYQASTVSSGSIPVMAINDLTDAYADYAVEDNLIMGRAGAAALTAGAQYNVFIGELAGATTANSTATTDWNTAIGYQALQSLTSGQTNTAVGQGTLAATTTGYQNLAAGNGALEKNIGGYDNAAVGFTSLYNNTTGVNNTALGSGALYSNVGKNESTAIGFSAMRYADSAAGSTITYNTAIGAYALQGSATAASNTGTYNTTVGHSTMIANTSGSYNVALGSAALSGNTTGWNNVALGSLTGSNIATGSNNILIGFNIEPPANNTSNHLNIGNTIYGDLATDKVGIGTAAPADLMHLYSTANVAGTGLTIDNQGASASQQSWVNIMTLGDGTKLLPDPATKGWSIFGRGNAWGTAAEQNDLGIAYWNGAGWANSLWFDSATGAVGIGTVSPASRFVVAPPTAEAVAAAAVITANACGTIKQINSTGNQTTNTTNTFTAPTASYAGCCMDVVNIDTVDTITLDQNANFFTGPGTDLTLGPSKAVRVCSDGTSWYQAASVTSVASGGNIPLSGLTAAIAANSINNADFEQTWNWQVTTADKDAFTFTENTASTATGHSSILKAATLAASTATPLMVTNLGAANSFRVNDETGDADTTPFVIDASGNVVIGGTTSGGSAIQRFTSKVTDTTNTAGYLYANKFEYTVAPTGNHPAGNPWGTGRESAAIGAITTVSNTNINDINIVEGLQAYAQNDGTGNITDLRGAFITGFNSANAAINRLSGMNLYSESDNGTVTNLMGLNLSADVSGGAASNVYGLNINMYNAGGTITNRYGIYLQPPTGTPTTSDFGIYQAGTQDNYFAGKVGIGTATPNAGAKLDVAGPIFLNGDNNGSAGDLFFGGGGWPYSIGVGWANQDVSLRLNPVGTAGGTADFRNVWIYDGKTNPIAQFQGSTKRFATGGDDSTPDAMLEVLKEGASPLMMLSATAAGNGDLMIVDANGNVGIGNTAPASRFVVAAPTAQTVAAAAVITANACGTIKQINSTGNQTTNTTNTFTAPTASYAGCCMDVVNVDSADTITLDQNANFLTGPGTDLALGPSKAVRVCSDGTTWYQAAAVSSVASGGNIPLSGLTAAIAANSINNADYAQTWNWQLTTADKDAFTFTENVASTATGHSSVLKAATLAASTATPLMVTNLGAANSFRVNDETGDADTSPFVVAADGKVGIGTAAPASELHVMNPAGQTTLTLGNPSVIGNNSSDGVLYIYGENGGVVQYSTFQQGGPNLFVTAPNQVQFQSDVLMDVGNSLYFYDASATKLVEMVHDGNDFVITNTNGDIVIPSDNVGIGTASPASLFVVASPAAETVAAAATITANSCGTVKQISATGSQTTNTTDTFTAPTASYSGCCMDVVNVDTVDTITLDSNAKFFTGAGTDVALAPGKGVRVCSDGTSWYQAGGVSSATAGSSVLSGITAAAAANAINNADYAQTWNWQLTTADKDAFTFTENTASTATGHSSVLKAATLAASTATPLMVTNLGAANSFRVNDETGDADTSPFVVAADGKVAIGTATPNAGAKLDVRGPVFIDGNNAGNPGEIFFGGGGWAYNIGVGWGGYSQLYINAVGTGGGTADFRDLGIMNGKANMIAFYQGSTKRFSVGGDDQTPDAMLEVLKEGASPLMMLSATAAGNGDLMIVDANGKVGIGTATPSQLLEIYGTNATAQVLANGEGNVQVSTASANWYENPTFTGARSRGTIAAPAAVQSGDSLLNMVGYGYDLNSWETAALIQYFVDGTPGDGDMPGRIEFQVQADGAAASIESTTPEMVIKNSGNVGIGFADPGHLLSVGANVEKGLGLKVANANGWENPYIMAERARGTVTAPTVVASGDVVHEFIFNAYDGTNFEEAAYIGVYIDGTPGNDDMPGRIEFNTQPDGSSAWMGDGATTPEMVIKSDGKVGIGVTSPSALLHVNGPIRASKLEFAGSTNEINEWSTNANAEIYMNYSGYNGGTTQFRDLWIGDGKNNNLVFVDGSTGSVGIGGATAPASKFVVAPPASEAVAAAAVITANACGTVKRLSATGSQTTNTTDTFTAPTASYSGCCMDVVNVDTVDTITLDQNAKFFTGAGTDLALGPGQGVRVCSDGTSWYQAGGVSSATAGSGSSIDGLTDAYADYTTLNNIIMGRASAAALAAGAQYNLFIGENAGATTANSTAATDLNVAVGHYALPALTSGSYNTAVGALTLQANTVGSDNVAIGTKALNTNVAKHQNTAIGHSAMEFADSAAGSTITYNTAVGAFALQGSATAANNTGTNNTALGHSALIANTSGSNNVALGSLTGSTITTGGSNILIGYDIEPPAATTSSHLNIGGTIFGDISTDNVRIGGSGAVGAGPLIANPPAAEGIAAAATITANSCGTVKQINATGNQTTNTTDTFTAPTASYSGCCMDVVNVDTVDTITLDSNAKFFTGAGTDVALAPGKGVRVCSDGAAWYQAGGVSSAAAGSTALSGVAAAAGDATIANAANNIVWNWQLAGAETGMVFGETAASAGGTTGASGNQFIAKASTLATSTATPLIVTNLGAANSFRVNDETGDTDATPFVIAADGKVGVGTPSPSQLLEVYGTTAYISLLSDGEGAVTSSAASANWWENGGFNASRSRGTIAAPTVVQSGDSVLTMWGTAYDGNSWETPALMQFFVDGTPGNGDMPGRIEFQTQADGAAVNPESTTPEMVIKNTGFVGIGIAAPGHLLSLGSDSEKGMGFKMGSANGYENPYIMTERSRGTNASPTVVASGDVIHEFVFNAHDGTNYEEAAYIGVYVDGTPGNDDMPGRIEFNTQPDGSSAWMGDGATTPEMVIKNNGRVGIGVAAPETELHVLNPASYTTLTVGNPNVIGNNVSDGYIKLYGENAGTVYTGTISMQSMNLFLSAPNSVTTQAKSTVIRGDTAGNAVLDTLILMAEDTNSAASNGIGASIVFNLEGSVNDTYRDAAKIEGVFDDVTDNSKDGSLRFYTMGPNAVSGTTTTTERMRIDSSGNVGIGTSTINVALDVIGSIEYTGTIADVSDIRLKKDIHPLGERGSMLQKLGLIDTYSFTMKDDKEGRVEFGVMAQEIEKIFPELVTTAKDEMGTKSVNYVGLIAPMIEAGKELEAQNKAMKAEIDTLKAQQDEMKQAMNDITEDMKGLKVHTGYGIGKAEMSLLMILAALGTLGAAGLARRRFGKPRQ